MSASHPAARICEHGRQLSICAICAPLADAAYLASRSSAPTFPPKPLLTDANAADRCVHGTYPPAICEHCQRQATTRAAPSEGPTPETCWLIERGQPEHHVPTVWWLGGLDWTETASEAAKFASRVAAEAEIRARSSYVGDPFGRATEHVFLSDSNAIEMPLLPVPLPVPAQEAEALVDGVVAWALACHCIGGTHVPYCQLPQRRADLLARLRSPSEIPEADDDRTVEQWHDDAMKYADRLLDAENQNLPDVARMFALLAFNCELAALRRASELKSSLATRAILLKSLTCLAADAFTPDRASRASRASRSPEGTPNG